MYHIQRDPRAQKSAKLIGEGMLQCLARKQFDEITVSDIHRASSVGRSTFYRLFDNTVDVLEYLCDSVFAQAEREYARLSRLTADDTTLRFVRIWMENKTLLKAITDSGRTALLQKAHLKYLAPSKGFIPESEGMDPIQVEYLMATLTSCITAFLTVWIKTGGTETAEQLQEHMKACFGILGQIFAETPDYPVNPYCIPGGAHPES